MIEHVTPRSDAPTTAIDPPRAELAKTERKGRDA